jgi:uncharacterized protein (DUF2235 family)
MKNIILLSDGTGNSAAKKNKTNVWRLYEALDLHNDKQIAMYDDGVGSKESTYNKILGGVFGYGLKRNVLELYKYLCRNFRDAEQNNGEADKIYLFGFSRGAFTVRVLAGFIAYAGICTDFSTEKQLHEWASANYKLYRNRYKHGYLTRIWRALFGGSNELHYNIRPDIEFVGVWDTVDAYVFPIDELAIIWDIVIYPIRFPDYELTPKVRRACHAVSVDDERHTFHPVMWDEASEKARVEQHTVEANRIEQVWFPGVHADVGGGYPRKSLSLVTLDWMISRVEADNTDHGMVFIKDVREQYKSQSDWNGPQHDSRSGLGSYYRYEPRNITRICDDKDAGIKIEQPKLHRSVFERIKGRSLPYAPTGIPEQYTVAATEGDAPKYETEEQRRKRAAALNYALDVIFWRRALYFALLLTTLVLITSRFFLDWREGGVCVDSACVIDPVIQLVIDSLPGFAAGWFEALRQNPEWLWILAGLFIVLFRLRIIAWRAMRQHAMSAWAELKGKGEVRQWHGSLTSKLRAVWNGGLGKAINWMSGSILFLVIAYLLFALVNGAVFHVRITFGTLCAASNDASLIKDERAVTLDVSKACYASGIKLEPGKTYRFEVEPDYVEDGKGNWATPDGLVESSAVMHLFAPLRRHITSPWIKLYGRVDDGGNENFELGSGVTEYTARSEGELFLYVNDAVFGVLPKWDYFYTSGTGTNSGEIAVKVTAVIE